MKKSAPIEPLLIPELLINAFVSKWSMRESITWF